MSVRAWSGGQKEKEKSHGTRRGSRRFGMMPVSVRLHRILEGLARAERSRHGRSDPDLRARPGIATRTRLAFSRLERAEARDLDTVAALPCFGDETGLGVEERVDCTRRIRLAHPCPVREFLHQIR